MRTVQPVLEEMETDVEDAAASLGASRFTTFRRVILPDAGPGDLRGRDAVVRPGDQRVRLAGAALAATCRTGPRSSSVRVTGSMLESGNRGRRPRSLATVLLVVALVAIVALDVIQRRVARRG